jgi:hypothetical protein
MSRLVLSVVLSLSLACSDSDRDSRAQDAGDEDAGEPDGETEEEAGSAAEAGAGGLCASCGGCEETRSGLSTQHRPEPIAYGDNPPMGGDHASCWSKFGVHTSAVPEARWVHNLEHGAVVFLYNCPDGCEAEVTQLEALARGRAFALVTPNARLPTRFAAVAWGVRLLSECLDRDAFAEFYEQHVDKAGESTTAPPPGGC